MVLTTKKLNLFLFGCIGTRTLLTILAYKIPIENLPIMGYIYIFMGFAFILNYIFKIRKTGIETGGEKIWWDNIRPLHAFLYLYFAYLAINKDKNAWKVLFIDTILGLFSFLNHHFL